MIILQRLYTESLPTNQSQQPAPAQEPVDISHLSKGAQNKIIARERKKIELEQKMDSVKESLMKSRERANMSVADNAMIGSRKLSRNPLVSNALAIGSMGISSAASDKTLSLIVGKHAKAAAKAGTELTEQAVNSLKAENAGKAAMVGMAARMALPSVLSAVGGVAGAVRGLTANMTAKRQEKKLARLAKKRAKLE